MVQNVVSAWPVTSGVKFVSETETSEKQISNMPREKTPRFLAQNGQLELFSHYDINGPMWDGEGARQVEVLVTFERPFSSPPIVQVSLNGIDAAHEQNLRLYVTAEKITKSSFRVVAKTWSDTRIARLGVSWMACGDM